MGSEKARGNGGSGAVSVASLTGDWKWEKDEEVLGSEPGRLPRSRGDAVMSVRILNGRPRIGLEFI
jgi:hypothetical protein